MTRDEKIVALALDLEAAWSGVGTTPTDRPSTHWLRAATLAQDRIDAGRVEVTDAMVNEASGVLEIEMRETPDSRLMRTALEAALAARGK